MTPVDCHDWPQQYIDIFIELLQQTDLKFCIDNNGLYRVLQSLKHNTQITYFNTQRQYPYMVCPLVEAVVSGYYSDINAVHIKCKQNDMYAFFTINTISKIIANADATLDDIVW